eukprot:g35740.t1
MVFMCAAMRIVPCQGAIVGKDRRAKIPRQFPGHRRSSPLIPRLDILNVGCRQFILGWVFFGIVSSRLMLR